jgi:hypothetical protein
MIRRWFVLGTIFSCVCIITLSAGDAWAKCAAGEVWGDLGCRPAAKPSILVKATRRVKAIRLHRKPSTQAKPDAQQQ